MEYRRGGKVNVFPSLLPPQARNDQFLLTVTAMGSPVKTTAPTGGIGGSIGTRLTTLSDPSALVHTNKAINREKILARRYTEPSVPLIPPQPVKQLRATRSTVSTRPPSCKLLAPTPTLNGLVLPPIGGSSSSEPHQLMTAQKEDEEKQQSCEEDDESSNESLLDDDESIDDILLSGIGFKDDSFSSSTALAEVSFSAIKPSDHTSYPVTLIQEQLLAEHQLHINGAQGSAGYNPRVNNIVRGFEIKGPLDKDLLQQALDKVVNSHAILKSAFRQRNDSNYYCRTSQADSTVKLELSMSYERPAELMTLARRKLFTVPIRQEESFKDENGSTHFSDIESVINEPENEEASLSVCSSEKEDEASNCQLISAKLITKSSQDFVLILSFSRVIADYWSSCLFIHQLVDMYGKLEKSPTYRPSMTALRQTRIRQETFKSFESIKTRGGRSIRGGGGNSFGVLTKRPLPPPLSPSINKDLKPRVSSLVSFLQVSLREKEILVVKSKERLYNFWQSSITATVRRTIGPPRVKVISPIRIPTGINERTSRLGNNRPMTSRLRPLTGRARPITARKISIDQSLSGPATGAHYIKVDESIGYNFIKNFPEEHKIDKKDLLYLASLSVYILILGRCCRGWDGNRTSNVAGPAGPSSRTYLDPLLKFKEREETESKEELIKRRRGKLDTGTFLIGIDVSLRQLSAEKTQGLLAPLTNTVGLRVDLSSYKSFTDMILALNESVHHCRCNGHFPFSTVADEYGLVHGIPVRFSYYNSNDVQQLSDPDQFFFIETAVGVEKKALSKMGSLCYINPLNTKMDDKCQLELFMWEGVRQYTIEGLFIFQTNGPFKSDQVMKSFNQEMIKLLQLVAQNPNIDTGALVSSIQPPFTNGVIRDKHRRK